MLMEKEKLEKKVEEFFRKLGVDTNKKFFRILITCYNTLDLELFSFKEYLKYKSKEDLEGILKGKMSFYPKHSKYSIHFRPKYFSYSQYGVNTQILNTTKEKFIKMIQEDLEKILERCLDNRNNLERQLDKLIRKININKDNRKKIIQIIRIEAIRIDVNSSKIERIEYLVEV